MQAAHASPATTFRAQAIAQPALWSVEPYEYPVFESPINTAPETDTADAELVPWQPAEERKTNFTVDPEPSAAEPVIEPEPILEPASALDEELLAEAREQGYEAGLKQGCEEGRIEARAQALIEIDNHIRATNQQRQAEFVRLTQTFHEAREHYLHQVEPEVVRLALAVAARILRREAQMDPLLLTGAVRVALGQIASSTKVRLKVPASDLPLWAEAIAHLPKLAVRPEVIAGENIRLGDCLIDTDLGSVDLGIRSQLSEIERGFFDRPGFRAEPIVPDSSETAIPRPEPTA